MQVQSPESLSLWFVGGDGSFFPHIILRLKMRKDLLSLSM